MDSVVVVEVGKNDTDADVQKAVAIKSEMLRRLRAQQDRLEATKLLLEAPEPYIKAIQAINGLRTIKAVAVYVQYESRIFSVLDEIDATLDEIGA